jgi:hypothetical protein
MTPSYIASDKCMNSAGFRIAATVIAIFAFVTSASTARGDERARRYTFSWLLTGEAVLMPRGGTTRGAAVKLVTAPSREWLALQEPGVGKFERDRRAILAMAGSYRTTFDFLETVGFTVGYAPTEPYQSWATEHIKVIEDRGDFVSLQHLLVMSLVDETGAVQGPFVMKHWRQDWQFEDQDLHTYRGRDVWERRRVPEDAAHGRWSQAVFQVDDSPRYEALGEWVHQAGYSVWTSENTWRPLPRREFSVRDDYDVLSGINRHTILPTGWVQEEDNVKVALPGVDPPATGERHLARELGVNRYERLAEFDTSAGERYWSNTAEFWNGVRAAWTELLALRERIELVGEQSEEPLWAHMLGFAQQLDDGAPYDAATADRFVADRLADYVR